MHRQCQPEVERRCVTCLDVSGGGTTNGTVVQIWDCTCGANQKWNAPAA
ncbi:RICIN domain-containing protein [Kibdelosporangium phytohabitans]|nr:RICIN domain-containing protein [Kibdelosporangium phytohabitans]